MKNIAVLFTNNLRLRDNKVLQQAQSEGDAIYPFYYFDTQLKNSSELGVKKIGDYRAQFLIESLENLRYNLQKVGSDIVILKGTSLDVIVNFVQMHNISKVMVQQAVGFDEIQTLLKLEKLLEHIHVELQYIWDHTLIHIDDLPFDISKLPDMYTDFRKAVEKNSEVRLETHSSRSITTPKIDFGEMLRGEDFGYRDINIDSRRAINHIGGEDEAWKRLNHYFWETEKLAEYKETRNGLIGEDYSSKLSAWLAHGCISSRSIFWEIKKFEETIIKNNSTYWLIFELLWRDFYQFVFAQDSLRFFHNYPKNHEILQHKNQKQKFESWKLGRTGEEFVDANMREIQLTGFMSNRGRQIVASYLVNDLKIDWRLGATYFEMLLIDYDVASNWGNWAYVAGVGNDPRDNRYFNIQKQQQNYDPQKKYIHLWLD